ncbi:hypothetical protein Misp01_18530 [Microtetraspora sp. NBRC 13810]|uniref:DUF1707 SHOCT-like domain-containing protein n=1 Tax=Microtetraspora sp. NBRC 13810 TaxID=3030990 RepID=UPI0024A53C2E|nr:DUF1707 domain-containing protein [Microtetraspora sp. NBRC 13810]GLW06723.1 hypothetical protein Misp01_18530 [Microtetraspora sp. NBRC 13810]
MENPPEPRDPASSLRASDANRESVADLLGQALSTGQLSHAEYSERLDVLYQAKTVGELEVLTHDLQVDRVQAPRPAYYAQGSTEESTDQLVAIFSGATRRGPWRVRRKTIGLAIFGGLDVDLTDAVFEAREVEIRVFALFGGAEIKIPPGAEVRCEGSGIFGGFDVTGGDTVDPGAPVITVRGLAIFGGVGGRPKKRKKN